MCMSKKKVGISLEEKGDDFNRDPWAGSQEAV